GLEEGLFPMSRAFDDYEQLEEERRLCYVGITRAKKKLFMTRATRRRRFGSLDFNMESRFLKDLPPDILEVYGDRSQDSYFDDYAADGSYASRRVFSSQKPQPKPKWDEVADVDFGFDFDQSAE